MPYRRHYGRRQFFHTNKMPGLTEGNAGEFDQAPSKAGDGIPLPTEEEVITAPSGSARGLRLPDFLSSITERIKMDDIILIGLIFMLFMEGLDDDFLLVILLYLLLTGRD